jgi:hypothetical protein
MDKRIFASSATEAQIMLVDEITESAFKIWHHRVLSGVRVKRPEDAERIAQACAEAEQAGDRYVSVWHEAASFYGTECHCRRCAG